MKKFNRLLILFIAYISLNNTVSAQFSQLVAPVANNASNITVTGFTANWTSFPLDNRHKFTLEISTNNSFSNVIQTHTIVGNGGTLYSKNITGLSASTNYYYRVKVKKGTAQSIWSNTITVTTDSGIPNAPAIQSATVIGTSSFTANWSASGGQNPAEKYFLDVSISSGFEPVNIVSGYNNLDVGNVTNKIVNSGLSCGTQYYYRVRAYNTYGTSGDSSHDDPLTLVPSPNATFGSNRTASSFTANWSSVSCASSYELDVWSDGGSTTTYLDITQTNQSITGLSCGTEYHYRVRAVNSTGTSNNSSTMDAYTLPTVTVGNSATSITATSFTANWTSVSCASSYILKIYITGYQGPELQSSQNVGNVTSEPITGLNGGIEYHYRIIALNANGDQSGVSSKIYVTTIPPPPVIADPYNIGESSFRLYKPDANFSPTSHLWDDETVVTSFRLDVSENSNFTSFVDDFEDKNVTLANGSNQYVDVNNLDPSTTYYCRFRSVNASGTSDNSNVVQATTASSGGRIASEIKGQGVSDLESFDFTQLYPNPTKDVINIVVSKDDLVNRIDIHDVSGKLMFSRENLELQNERYPLDLNGLENGVYVISGYSNKSRIFNERIIKE